MLKRLSLCFAFYASAVLADTPNIANIVDDQIISRYQTLAERSARLDDAAQQDCAPDNPDLRTAFGEAFDAWIAVSHLRFGPSEKNDRAFALSFWPDSRSKTPKALTGLMSDHNPIINDAEAFEQVSVAARGFYPLELMLFDPAYRSDHSCALIRAQTRDIVRLSDGILTDWNTGYTDLLRMPNNDTYRSKAEAVQQLFTALTTGLQFTSDVRLGRPLGTFDRPRPKRAEARRSKRSLRHVILSLNALRPLAAALSGNDPELDIRFERALKQSRDLDDPVFAGVADPLSRIRVEALQTSIDEIRRYLDETLGPKLSIASGFNALDGD